MKKILFFVAVVLLGSIPYTQAQTTYTIDFSYETLNNNCNVFASNVTVDNFVHQSTIGFPKFTGNPDYYVNLPCKRNSQSSQVGTEYQIKFPFKKNYKYQINAYYKGTIATSNDYYPVLALRLNPTALAHNTATNCAPGPGAVSLNYTGYAVSGSGFAWPQNPIINTPQPLAIDYESLSVAGYPAESPSASGTNAIQVRAIVITEFPPAPTNPVFTLPASVNITCGSASAQQFTITNVNNSTGISAYNWDLGSASNGWLYNGTPAPQNISTPGNTISLTPVCGATQQSVKAIVTVNGTNYSTNTMAVNYTLPSLSINGNAVIGSAENYNIAGLPCNASVAWSVTPAGLASLSCTNCDQTTLTAVANGNLTLSATVTACGQSQTITKNLSVCMSNSGVATNLTGTLSWVGTSYYGYTLNFTPVPGATSYHMEWFDVTNNSLLNTYPVPNPGYFYYYFSAGRTYKYRLAVETSCGTWGPYSAWSDLLQPPPASCANGPIGSTLSQSPGCNGSSGCTYTNLSWPAIAGALQYKIEYSIVNISAGIYLPTTTIYSSYPYASPNYSPLSGTGWTIQYRVAVNCSSAWGNFSGYSVRFFLQ
ncbi:hypothetical protein [Chitinophaga niabensis]|uniref:PKD domain-containing protein n=1 Tax=Chitinophaga niabensis TaxID=536979 RepID=A0A1N6GJ67_9BACT|nr:hypothetical protein [Chitinophaga niabensis]SIO07573.1 hypothetical protein SAMN04488055_2804 [Chitinophaga niabensis]